MQKNTLIAQCFGLQGKPTSWQISVTGATKTFSKCTLLVLLLPVPQSTGF